MLDRESVLLGLFIGAIIAGLGGHILQRIRKARFGMALPGKSMSVRTEGTPRGVMQIAREAARACLFWTGVLVLFLAGSIGIIYWLVVILAR